MHTLQAVNFGDGVSLAPRSLNGDVFVLKLQEQGEQVSERACTSWLPLRSNDGITYVLATPSSV